MFWDLTPKLTKHSVILKYCSVSREEYYIWNVALEQSSKSWQDFFFSICDIQASVIFILLSRNVTSVYRAHQSVSITLLDWSHLWKEWVRILKSLLLSTLWGPLLDLILMKPWFSEELLKGTQSFIEASGTENVFHIAHEMYYWGLGVWRWAYEEVTVQRKQAKILCLRFHCNISR